MAECGMGQATALPLRAGPGCHPELVEGSRLDPADQPLAFSQGFL